MALVSTEHDVVVVSQGRGGFRVKRFRRIQSLLSEYRPFGPDVRQSGAVIER